MNGVIADEEREGKIEKKKDEEGEVKEGVASIALLPSGSISGHFIQMPSSICYGLHGTGNFTLLLLGQTKKNGLFLCWL